MRDHTRTRAAGVVALLIAGTMCLGCSADDSNVSLEIRIVQEAPADHLKKMTMIVWGGQKTYYVHDEVLLSEDDVAVATVVKQSDGAPAMRIVLNDNGQQKLLRVTKDNVGYRLGVVIDGRLQCAPPIEEPIENGIVMVTGHMLERAAQRCSRALTRGAA